MESPFPPSTSSAGCGRVVAKLLPAGGTGLEAIAYQYPLKLISPSPSAYQKSVLVFLLSYGGGLVGGDSVNLAVRVKQDARLSIVTQGHTKIFKSPSPEVVTTQKLDVQLDAGAALCLLPDPVQPFANSVYTQAQIFRAHSQSSLCFLDWVTQGRKAHGEDWSFIQWTGRNEVWLSGSDESKGGKLLVRDTVILSKADSVLLGRGLKEMMHGLAVFGTLILRGTLMSSLAEFFRAEFESSPRLGSRDFRSQEDQDHEEENRSEFERWRTRRLDMEKQSGILWSAAQVRGCTVVKFGAPTVEAGREWIGDMLAREGTISKHFGDEALMCVR